MSNDSETPRIYNAQWELVPDDTGVPVMVFDEDLGREEESWDLAAAGWESWWSCGGDFEDEGIDSITLFRKGDRWVVNYMNYSYGFNVLCQNPGEAMRVIRELRETLSIPVKPDEKELERQAEMLEAINGIKTALWEIANDNDSFYRTLCGSSVDKGLLPELKEALDVVSSSVDSVSSSVDNIG